MRRTIFSIVLLVIGMMMLMRASGIESFEWLFGQAWFRYGAPVCITVVGFWLLFNRDHSHFLCGCGGCRKDIGYKEAEVSEVMDENAMIDASLLMASDFFDLEGERFAGGNVSVCMGNVKLDLRKATIQPNCILKLTACMGKIQLLVPQQVRLEVYSSNLMAHADHRKVQCTNPEAPLLRLQLSNCMSSIQIQD